MHIQYTKNGISHFGRAVWSDLIWLHEFKMQCEQTHMCMSLHIIK